MTYNNLVIPPYLNVCFNANTVTLSINFPIKPETICFVSKYLKMRYKDNMTVRKCHNTWRAGARVEIPYTQFNQQLINNTITTKKHILNAIHMAYSDYYKSLVKK